MTIHKRITETGDQQWWLGVAWGIAMTALGLGLLFLLGGCTTTAYVTGEHASSAGYDPGVGVRVESVRRSGTVRPRVLAKVAAQHKKDAETGYTYSGLLGAQWHGRIAFAETGWVTYGYSSEFPDGTIWRNRQSTYYLRAGGEWDDFLMAASYYPPSDDSYNSDEVKLELRWLLKRGLAAYVEPSVFRYAIDEKRETGTALSVGIGYRW